MIKLSLFTGYIPQAFKSLFKKLLLDPNVLAKYRPTFLSFQNFLKETSPNTDHLHLQRNGLFNGLLKVHRSTGAALVKVMNYLLMGSNSRLLSMVVLTDLSAQCFTTEIRTHHCAGLNHIYLIDSNLFMNSHMNLIKELHRVLS